MSRNELEYLILWHNVDIFDIDRLLFKFIYVQHSPTGASIWPGPGVIKMAGAGFSLLF